MLGENDMQSEAISLTVTPMGLRRSRLEVEGEPSLLRKILRVLFENEVSTTVVLPSRPRVSRGRKKRSRPRKEVSPLAPKRCAFCANSFVPTQPHAAYCSTRCKDRAARLRAK